VEAKEDDHELNLSENDNDIFPERILPQKRKRTKKTKLMNDVLTTVVKTKRPTKKKMISPPHLSDDDTF
jgi:hypothetical protein